MPLPRPDGHHVITPAAIVEGAAKVLEFVEKAFGGRVTERYDGPDGGIAHSEIMVGDSVVMVGDAFGGMEPMPAALSVYVEEGSDVDATFDKAMAAGATEVEAPTDKFYGYRSATVKDTGGNRWTICAVTEKLTAEEIQARMAKL